MDTDSYSPEIEVIESEDYRSDKDLVFNHQTLVMEVLRKANEAGCHELREGWINQKTDNSGNIVKTYIEDTRKKFIESVNTAVCVMSCDFDKDAKANLKKLKEGLETEKKKLLKSQFDWWKGLPPRPKQQYANSISQVFFSKNLGWYYEYLELQVECFRKILQELHELTERKDFYQVADFEA